jgi:hypothetical protein
VATRFGNEGDRNEGSGGAVPDFALQSAIESTCTTRACDDRNVHFADRQVKGWSLREEQQRLDPLKFRFRYLIGIVLAAILIAAALRHTLHVYGGLSRQNIRADALIALLIVVAAVIALRRLSRR